MTKFLFKLIIACLIMFSANSVLAVTIKSSSLNPCQGETVEITVAELAEPIRPIEFLQQKYKLFLINDSTLNKSYHCLVPIPVTQKPGSYALKYNNENIGNLNVKSANFTIQKLTLPKTKDNFIMSPGEAEAIDQAKATLTDRRFFDTKFVQPVNARVSTQFGLRRIVNGKLLDDYFHSGIDYAANFNTSIKACAPGIVVLARHNFKLHGNTVCINHGQGVVSIYIHMNKIMVKEGQEVKIGQIIGTVGQSGRANGPHLHFSIYVNQIATNPKYWYEKVY